MKKIVTLLCIIAGLQVQSQFINQLTFIGSYTPGHIDTLLSGQGVPTGVFNISYNVDLYKVVYNTVDWDSNYATASGLLCVPQNTTCQVPMLSYQHGTTLQKTNVPSNLQIEWYVGLAAAGLGYVTVLPDYLGLGTSSVPLHPYQHAHTEATAVIDMIRAGKEAADSLGSPVNDQLFLFGYSQGGHATMAAHQLIQEKLDNVMHVTASAPMSGAYDMSGVMADVMTSNNPYPEPFYLPFLILGYNEVYHLFTADSDAFIHPFDSTLPPLFDGTHSGGDVDNAMGTDTPKLIMQPVQLDSFINDSVNNFFRVKLSENNTYNWVPTSPLKMYFCEGDQSVNFHNAIVAYQHFIQNGATTVDTVVVSHTLDHVPCAQFAILAGTEWFQTMLYKPIASGGVSTTHNTSAVTPNGSATITATFGDPPYKYAWSNGDSTATITGLDSGTYIVTVTDRSHCGSFMDTAVIQSVISGLQDEALSNVQVYPNPSKGMINIRNLNTGDNLKETLVYDMEGRLIKTYTIRQGNILQLYFAEAAQGIYYVCIKSESGKELRKKVTVLE
jgi:hypothetical protein